MKLVTKLLCLKAGWKGILHGFDKMFMYSHSSVVQLLTLTIIICPFYTTIGASLLNNTINGESCPESQGYVLHIVYTTDYKIFRCCEIVSCGPGEEIKTCTEDFGTDRCVQCESGYIQPDNITSKLPAECYYTECVEESKWTPMGCICDTKQNYYGMDPYKCTYKKCPSGQELLLDGSCVSPLIAALIPPNFLLTTKPVSKVATITRAPVFTKTTMEVKDTSSVLMTTKTLERTTGRKENDKKLHNINVWTVIIAVVTISILVIFIFIIVLLCFPKNRHVRFIQKKLKKVRRKDVKETTPLTTKRSVQQQKTLEWGTRLTDEEKNRKSSKNLFKKTTKSTVYNRLPNKHEAGKSVGMLMDVDGCRYGTGFVVGGKYVLGNYHTLETMAENRVNSPVDLVDALWFEINGNWFKFDSIKYYDTYLDFAILCLKSQNGVEFPPSILAFGDICEGDRFDFIGHPGCNEKEIDQECEKKDNIKIQELTDALGELMIKHNLDISQYPFPYDELSDKHYYFNSAFGHGSSGSPAFVFHKQNVRKCVALLSGCYPKFIHDDSFPEYLRQNIPEFIFEFGLKMSVIFMILKRDDLQLCEEIFRPGHYPSSWDCAAI